MRVEDRITIFSRVGGCLLLAMLAFPAAGAGAPKKARALETTHVTLYDCGLAQHERQTRVSGAERLEIQVSLAHLDDLLATLVLATDGGVKVREVRYPSVQNLGQAVAASGLGKALYEPDDGLAGPADLVGYIRAIRGTRVVIHTARGQGRTGTVIDCVTRAPKTPADESANEEQPARAAPEYFVVLATPEGAVSWIPLIEVSRIEPVSRREAQAVGDLAAQLGRATGFTGTGIVLETAAGSHGRLAASYVRQAPLWRTIYKVSAQKDGVMLEAWALVHNDTDEDWNEVEMTLISGLPRSYVVSIASPRYQEREALYLENEGGLMPQLGAATPDSLLYDWEVLGQGAFGLSGSGSGGGGYGIGSSAAMGIGRGSVVGTGGSAGERTSSLLQVGQSAAGEEMAAAVEGEISTYRALDPVSIPAGSSALVPVLRRRLEGQAFTLLRQGEEPATCVRARNDSGLVLQSGLATFYIHGRFRGQVELPRTEPGEIDVWCHGGDPDVRFTTRAEVDHERTALEWLHGELMVHSLKKTRLRFDVENLAGQGRRIALEASHIANGRVISPDVIPADTPDTWLHLLDLDGASRREATIRIEEGVMNAVPIEREALLAQVADAALPAAQRAVLKRAADFLDRAGKARAAATLVETAQERLGQRVERQRVNLAAVPTGS
ncbi:MAG TPA: DUF4139 domain-containing protein, partial [Polyangia bacterium]|nr:DUF4139 domain-containing protein [Polyangia bacterium]